MPNVSLVEAVRIGRVEKRDAGVERGMEKLDRTIVVSGGSVDRRMQPIAIGRVFM